MKNPRSNSSQHPRRRNKHWLKKTNLHKEAPELTGKTKTSVKSGLQRVRKLLGIAKGEEENLVTPKPHGRLVAIVDPLGAEQPKDEVVSVDGHWGPGVYVDKSQTRTTPNAKNAQTKKPSDDPHGFAPNPETTKELRDLKAPDTDQAAMNQEAQEIIRSLGTQLAIQAMTGISQGHLSGILNGVRDVSIDSLNRLREASGSDAHTKEKAKIDRTIDSIYDEEHKRIVSEVVLTIGASRDLAADVLAYAKFKKKK